MNRAFFAASRTFVLLATAGLMAACADGTSADNAMIQVQMTDAPSDMIQSAEVWVSRVYLQGGPGHAADTADASTGGRVDLFNDKANPFHVDLLLLRNGLVANLTDSVSVEAGDYKQLRIVVDSATVTLKAPYKFENGTTSASLKIPSGSSSGVKVDLSTNVATEEGEVFTILVDVDVNQNFVIQSTPNAPNVIRSILFTPVIKEKARAKEQL